MFFSYLGGPGGLLRRTYGCQNFRGDRPHHRADACITRENIAPSFSYISHNVKYFIIGYSKGPGPSIIRQYQYTSTYKIWKQYLSCVKLQSHHPVSEPVRCRQSKYLLPAWSPCISAGPPSSCSS